MLTRISKEFRWEMGHRLPYHTEGCQNIHGHSYRMVVELIGETDESGMVLDFGEISQIVRPILAQLDHSFMVDPWDAMMQAVLRENNLKATPVEFFSTAENIAHWMLSQVRAGVQSPRIHEIAVQVFETVTSMAEARWTRES